MINKILKEKTLYKKPIYIYISKIKGINVYRSKLIFNLSGNYFYKKYINLNKINSKCINFANKHSIFNINLFKKNSIKFNKKRLFISKNNNENKNFYKKNM